ncbi:MAG: UMP kinase [Phycisphaeraceae bacterium]|nr:UMP kinase [Phycisphaeraceae bacterium]
MTDQPYKRVLLKLSGEAFCSQDGFGIDGEEMELIAREVVAARETGVEMAVVVGGGNIIRGAELAEEGHINQASADYMGMLGTAINGLALKETLERIGQPARLLSAIDLPAVAETFIRARAIRHLEKGRVVVFAAGTGNPFFTTDTAAALRATEIGADVLLKATKVDGVYDKDPNLHEDAQRFETLTFREAMDRDLQIMDRTAFAMCYERNIPVVVFNMKEPGHIREVVEGTAHGTRITNHSQSA